MTLNPINQPQLHKSGMRLILLIRKPVFAEAFNIPKAKVLAKPLIIGAILFGMSWGLAGLCPGSAIASLAQPSEQLLYFLVSMFVGSFIARKITK
jgi:hypothetical protein